VNVQESLELRCRECQCLARNDVYESILMESKNKKRSVANDDFGYFLSKRKREYSMLNLRFSSCWFINMINNCIQ
jgi:hypothetical protein